MKYNVVTVPPEMTFFTPESLVAGVLAGERRAIARAISTIENEHPLGFALSRSLYPHGGKSKVLGITGPPGVGKSTLVDCLALELVRRGERVGVLAIDPTSPFSGGALLGDRIRMVAASANDSIFIRSMATRGARGGIARTTYEAVNVLDAAGYSTILLETVGVGQIEVEVALVADCTLLVLMPGTGDLVQALKAGIAEVANLFIINKSDLPGADLLESILTQALSLDSAAGITKSSKPEVIKVTATQGVGITELAQRVTDLETSKLCSQRAGRLRNLILRLVEEQLARRLPVLLDKELDLACEQCSARRDTPHDSAVRLAQLVLAAS